MYEDLVELITRKRVAFPPFGHGVSDTAIHAAEVELGIAFPPSYRWWLRNCGGGQIGGDIVYGLDEAGIDAPDIVRLQKANVAERVGSPHELVFYLGNEESFHFDIRQLLGSGEYRIYYRETGQPDTEYADSFDAFLRKRIIEILGR
jgi:hypothetical protein